MNTDIKKSKSNNLPIGIIVIIIAIIFLALYLFFYKSDNKESKYTINLLGNKYIILNIDEKYVEPGFNAIDNNNVSVTNEVIITNDIDNSKPGIYRVIYKIGDTEEYRYVEVKKAISDELEILLETNKSELTSDDVIISVTVNGDLFNYLVLPNKSVITSNYANYVVKENGVYVFEAINNDFKSYIKEITINNIDKEAPNGTCTATLNTSNTIVKVETNEDNITYNYYDNNKLVKSSNESTYTFNYKSSNNIEVVLEDSVSNSNKITCNIIDNRYYDPVVPSSNEKIVYHGEADTLKAYIVDRGSYYLTYIWVKDAYTQLNKFNSPEYGKNLYRPSDLLSKANTAYNLNNKIMIGFNASAFYLKGTFDADSVSAYPAYDKTSVGTIVITNGQVIRNAYQYAVKTWYTIGVNKENKLLVFEDKKTNNVEEKQAWAQSVISSGIRNTFTFAAPIMQNGVKTGITTSMPGNYSNKKGLQLFCQINENNFLLFTSSNESRDNAIKEFTKLGCQTAMNLDGGGSIALLYKDKNSNDIKKVIGNNRSLPEVGYFTE